MTFKTTEEMADELQDSLFLLNNLTTIKLAHHWPVILIAIGLAMLFSPRDES